MSSSVPEPIPGSGDSATQTAPPRQRDAERTRSEILDVATREFAELGYAGARVDEIAAKTRTTKRMIYYYFGGKEQLFVTALERAYARIRTLEKRLDVEHLDPLEALRALAELTVDHHQENPDFIRLVSIENMHYAEHIAGSESLSNLANPALEVLDRILERGRAAGIFRGDIDALDVHQVISSFCVYRIANRYTFRAIFGRDMLDPDLHDRQRRLLGDLVVAHVTTHR